MTTIPRHERVGNALVLGFSIAVIVVIVAWLAGVNLTQWWLP